MVTKYHEMPVRNTARLLASSQSMTRYVGTEKLENYMLVVSLGGPVMHPTPRTTLRFQGVWRLFQKRCS